MQIRQGHATLGELRKNARVRDVNASWIHADPIKVCDLLGTVREARVHDVNASWILEEFSEKSSDCAKGNCLVVY